MAYRAADHERWQNLDFVVGIEIHLSGNHTSKGRDGKPHRFEDICDQLKGKYPKDFKFTGWHPHCRCYATSILKTEEEMDADTQRILNGEPVDGDSVNKVEEPPKGFSDWMEKNEGRIAEARKNGTLPGFVRENERIVNRKGIDANSGNGDRAKEPPAGSAAMPSNLASFEQEEWNNNKMEVSEELEIKQEWPMTHEQADKQHANPNYIAGIKNGYDTNCQSCVVAYEMRRRGFDVEALRYEKGNINNGPWRLSLQTESAWIDIKTKCYPEKIQCGGANKSAEIVKEEINTATKEIGRYHINWGWKCQELGHIIVAERLPNSELFLFDPQTGKEFNWEEKVKRIDIAQRLFVLKVDGLMINTPVVKTIVKVKG